MGATADLGKRIELVPMDPHFEDITIALYARGPEYLVHTYSPKPGAPARIAFVRKAMAALGGMEENAGLLRFPCGDPHASAVRRVFLEACKLPTGEPPAPKPLAVDDKKSGQTIAVYSAGSGVYELAGADPSRLDALANGLCKLGGMSAAASAAVAFACNTPHDELVGLLLVRALNVRAAMREIEAAAGRGVLVAPSAQK